MELTAEQDKKFRDLCREIKPDEYARVIVSFGPSRFTQITSEKNYRFYREKAESTTGEPVDRRKSGRY